MIRPKVRSTLIEALAGTCGGMELRRRADDAGYPWFADLVRDRFPPAIPGVSLRGEALRRRVRAVRSGEVSLEDLRLWALEVSEILENHRLAFPEHPESLLVSLLEALAAACHPAVALVPARWEEHLDLFLARLSGDEPFRTRHVICRLFEDVPVLHLLDKRAHDAGRNDPHRQWTDVVALDRPWREGVELYEERSWIEAFTVSTHRLFEDEWAGDGGGGGASPGLPERARDGLCAVDGTLDRIPSVRRRVPNFDLETYRPRYVHGPSGLCEVVLDTDRIGWPEVVYATKLFTLINRTRVCRLDGRRVPTLLVDEPVSTGDR